MKNALLQLIGRLGFRFALVLAVALLPLTIVAVIRSQSVILESEARSQAALSGETLRALAPALAQIERVKGAAIALANTLPALEDQSLDQCRAVMRQMVDGTDISFAGASDLQGTSRCSSADDVVEFGLTDDLRRLIANPRLFVSINQAAPVSQTSVVYASAPIFDGDVLRGFAHVSAPHMTFDGFATEMRDVAFMTVSDSWDILTSTVGIDEGVALLPVGFGEGNTRVIGRAFTALTAAGEKRTYAIVPVIPDQLFALGTWPSDEVGFADSRGYYLSNPAIFPALMWLASLLVAWFGCEILVIRHVRNLRRAMVTFADTRQDVRNEDVRQAPLELRDAEEAFRDMAQSVLRDEAELENALRQKDILLREVHHRVKNNLQLIASIMNMQMRRSRSPEVQLLMRGLHDRVMSLSTIHRGLYQTSGLAHVRADELLADIVRQVLRIGTGSENSIDLKTEFDPIQLVPDQAVPLGLMATEALTNALKYIGAEPGERRKIVVRLKSTGPDSAVFEVANSITDDSTVPREPGLSTGLGTQLLDAFSQQLYGTLTKEAADGWFTLSLAFAVEDVPEEDITTQ